MSKETTYTLNQTNLSHCTFYRCKSCKACILKSSDIMAAITIGDHTFGRLFENLQYSTPENLILSHVMNQTEADFRLKKGARLDKICQQIETGPLKDWETVPIKCGKCVEHTIGWYIVSAAFESLIGAILVDFENGVQGLEPADNVFEKKINMMT